jgi:hypothetical protein
MRLVGQVKQKRYALALAASSHGWLGSSRVGTETESQFQVLLRRAVDVAGQKQAAAKALGITPSRFSKLFHAAPGSYTLSVRNCFRLAGLLGESPQLVLRAVGKGEIAEALDVYAPPRAKPIPPDPLVSALDQALKAGADRRMAEAMLNALREQAGLPAIGQRRAHTHARAR